MLIFAFSSRALTCVLVSFLVQSTATSPTGDPSVSPLIDLSSPEPVHQEIPHIHAYPDPQHHGVAMHGTYVPHYTLPAAPPPAPEHAGPSVVNHPGIEEPLVVVPRLQEEPQNEMELHHIKRQFEYRLAQVGIEPKTVELLPPLSDVRHIHLNIIHSQLQLQVNSKQALYLGPTIGHTGRIFAVPIHRDMVKEAVIDSDKNRKVGWVVVGVKSGRQPQMTWLYYALHDVKMEDRRTFVERLIRSKKVWTLKDALTRFRRA